MIKGRKPFHCPNCQTLILIGDIYCKGCGARLDWKTTIEHLGMGESVVYVEMNYMGSYRIEDIYLEKDNKQT
ncbi:MAG TPA: hypothetical protein DHS57_03670 [Erysipelotrichaceae bacterium]|nr:hypothetical protein [Erysipelotrichaceae bacterium]